MDRKETEHLGICNKLFDFVMKSIALQALKKSTLGNPVNHIIKPDQTARGTSSVDAEPEKIVPRKRSNPSSSLRDLLEKDREKDDIDNEKERATEESLTRLKAPKKMVSINDRAEDVHKIMKKRKKSGSFDKLNSFHNEEDDPKPLRPILKVPSNLDKKTEMIGNIN